MGTGYTCNIEKGQSFNDFVMGCARGMGVCFSMRDEPHDKPIPDKFELDRHHEDKIKQAEKELAGFKTLTPADWSYNAKKKYEGELKSRKESAEKHKTVDLKYIQMLEKVEAWKIPTSEHRGFRSFMISQIKKSRDFDGMDKYYKDNPIELQTGEDWAKEKEKSLVWDFNYHTKEWSKEKERNEGRNNWIKQLRDSLVNN